MLYGITLPNIDYDAQVVADLAVDAEEAGWDGVFVWDCINMRNQPAHDPWMILAAIAARTRRIGANKPGRSRCDVPDRPANLADGLARNGVPFRAQEDPVPGGRHSAEVGV